MINRQRREQKERQRREKELEQVPIIESREREGKKRRAGPEAGSGQGCDGLRRREGRALRPAMRGALSPKEKERGSLTAPSCLHFCSLLPFQSCFRSNSSENESPGFLVSSPPPYQAQGTNLAPGAGPRAGAGEGLARAGELA